MHRQLLAGCAVNLAGTITGTILGWTSPSLPILEAPGSPIPITKSQNSWIASLMPLGAVFGPFIAGYLAEKFGRKRSLLLSVIPITASWISLAAGKSVEIIYAARFAAGFTTGWIFTVVPMYGGEIANKTIRGAILSLTQFFIVVGLLLDYCIGPYIPYVWLSIVASSVPLIFTMIFMWMPESPYYYLSVHKKEEAEKALQWLKGTRVGLSSELADIQASVEKAKYENGSLKDLFATRVTTKAFIISLGMMTFQQFSGINAVLFNSQSIFDKAGGSLKPEESTIVVGIIMLLSSAVTPFIVDRLGRKALLLISGTGMAAAHGVLGLCFYLEKVGTEFSSANFLPLLALVCYIIVYSIGFGPLPWTLMGELFPSNVKPLASTLTASFCWFLAFIITRFFNDIVYAFGSDYLFWMFSVFCILAICFVYFYVPETKGKSLNEIQLMLARSS